MICIFVSMFFMNEVKKTMLLLFFKIIQRLSVENARSIQKGNLTFPPSQHCHGRVKKRSFTWRELEASSFLKHSRERMDDYAYRRARFPGGPKGINSPEQKRKNKEHWRTQP